MSSANSAVPARIIKTGPRGIGNPLSEFSALLHTVRDAGLLRRRVGFYVAVFAGITVAMAAAWAGLVLLQDTWYVLIIAAVMGALFTQYAFITHELAHRQVFTSGKTNDFAGRFMADLVVGISYSWWMSKHTRHHANPNTVDKDPDIETDFIIFQKEKAVGLRPFAGFLAKRQGYLFFPALLLEGLNLHMHAFKTVFSPGKVDKRALEIVLLLVRNVGLVAIVFAILPLGAGFAFLGVMLAVFGVYMGASFAPNHKGMPILPKGSKVDFLRRQVLTSRNITSGVFMNHVMGGLNYQVEHHLFPSMPRPHLKRAGEIVREYCESRGIPYTEVGLFTSYGIVIRYLNEVGLGAGGDPFDCPAAGRNGYAGFAAS
ncbi:acyl-CoA desaturase [Leifsonia sp. H3M29-4]|uniref:fatty acid desaturase family protein n=1 Tax=Salinibacterium metalliresistens TaxID=3031321 RepID=UPI0023DC651A|nr:acyl-CoA desaturase [Salinibacterium metalliresistens]MDF1479910.1 acyl-CoA desaturase [Salinibacterium metalliresistens]